MAASSRLPFFFMILHPSIRLALMVPTLVVLPGVTSAVDDADLLRCAAMSSDAVKLACFEALATQAKNDLATQAATSSQIDADAPRQTPSPNLVSGEGEVAATRKQDEFGLEQKPDHKEARIQARHVGEFRGWSGQTLFQLENGQLWQQASPGRFFQVTQQPLITIRRGTLGSYWLSVEGANPRVRVIRVK